VKESFDLGNLKDTNWPQTELPEFRTISEDSYNKMRILNQNLLECIAVGLGLEPMRFARMMDNAYSTMRYLHYINRELSESELKDINSDG